jgi:hypothetical protein
MSSRVTFTKVRLRIMGDFRTVKPMIILDAFYPSLKVGILFDL